MTIRALMSGLVLTCLAMAGVGLGSAAEYGEGETIDPETAFAGMAASDVKEFYIVTVHVDGKTSTKGDAGHPPEPVPDSVLPEGGGILRGSANEAGKWRMRTFAFLPSQIVVRQGDRVRLSFVGVQGPSHRIAVEGQGAAVTLKRGEMKSIEFTVEKPGLVHFASLGRLPSMRGSVLVLPE